MFIYKMYSEKISLEIYEFVIHKNLMYHCLLFENKDIKVVLPFETIVDQEQNVK